MVPYRPSAVGIQLALMLAISLVTIVAFSFLRPNNSMVYQPKIKYSEDGKAPPKLEKGFFDWCVPACVLLNATSTLKT